MQVVNDEKMTYLPLPRFPSVRQDLTLKVGADQAFVDLMKGVDKALSANAPDDTLIKVVPLGVYQANDDKAHKNVSFRINVTGTNRTLTDQEVTHIVEAVVVTVREQFGAEPL
jgi:phenylalanyl-tRNA synthetase beta chain